MLILGKNSPPFCPFSSFLHPTSIDFFSKTYRFRPKTIGFTRQFLSICTANRQPLSSKSIGIAMQIDRFCISYALIFLHTQRRFLPKYPIFNRLSLHTQNSRKTDLRFLFSFFCDSQRV